MSASTISQPFVAEFRRVVILLITISLLLGAWLTHRVLRLTDAPHALQRFDVVSVVSAVRAATDPPVISDAQSTRKPTYRYCKHQEGYFDVGSIDLQHQQAPCVDITQQESRMSLYQLSQRYPFDDCPAWNITAPDDLSSKLYYVNQLPTGHVYAIFHTVEETYGIIQVQHYHCAPDMHRGSLNASLQTFLEQATGPDTLELRVIGPEAVGWIMRPVIDSRQWLDDTTADSQVSSNSIDRCVYSTRYDVSIAGQYNIYIHSLDHQYNGASQCDTGQKYCTPRIAMRPQMAVFLNETRMLAASPQQPMLSQSNYWPDTETTIKPPSFEYAQVGFLPPLPQKFGRWVHTSQLNATMLGEYKGVFGRRFDHLPQRPLCNEIGDLKQYHFIPYQYTAAGQYQPQTAIHLQRPYTVEDIDATCLRGTYLFHGDSQTRTTFSTFVGTLLNNAEYKARKQRAGLNDTLQSDCVAINAECDMCYGADLHELDNNWDAVFINLGQHPASFYMTMEKYAEKIDENMGYMPAAFNKNKLIWMEGVAHPNMWIESYFTQTQAWATTTNGDGRTTKRLDLYNVLQRMYMAQRDIQYLSMPWDASFVWRDCMEDWHHPHRILIDVWARRMLDQLQGGRCVKQHPATA